MSTTDTTATPAGGEREARLAAAARQLSNRVREANFERLLFILGGIAMSLGIVLIIIGWLGVSHSVLPFEQNAYIVSGGRLGLGLVVVGAALYLAHWLTQFVRESREQHVRALREARGQQEQLLDALTRIEGLLRDGAGDASNGRSASTRPRSRPRA